jgi:hypothetical protein
MSMNLHVNGTRQVTVTKTGKSSTQTTKFGLWQTPTDVTYAILEAPNVKQAYIDWVKSVSKPQKYPVYAEEDVLGDGDPIGYEEVDHGAEHIKELNEWLSMCEDEGYEVEFFYL